MTKILLMTLCALSLSATAAMAQDQGGTRDRRPDGRDAGPPPQQTPAPADRHGGGWGGGGPGRPPQPPPPPPDRHDGHDGGGHGGGWGGGGPGRPPQPPPPPPDRHDGHDGGGHGGGWGGGPGRPPQPPPPPPDRHDGHDGGHDGRHDGRPGGFHPGPPVGPPPGWHPPIYHRPPPQPAGGYATVQVQQIPRTGGGTWLNVHFNYPINSDDLNIEVRSARLEIHEGYAVTASGVQYTLFQLQETGVINAGDSRGASLSDIPEAIQDIYIRAEAWGAMADAEISVGSRYGMPSISVYLQQ